MTITNTKKGDNSLTHVLMDSGDIAMCPATDTIGRKYVLLTQCDEGERGTAKDTGREFPVKDGHIPGENEPTVMLEFGEYGALQQLIETLWGHGREKFPGDWVNLEGAEMVDGLFLLIDQLKSAAPLKLWGDEKPRPESWFVLHTPDESSCLVERCKGASRLNLTYHGDAPDSISPNSRWAPCPAPPEWRKSNERKRHA